MKTVFADTSFFIALLHPRDECHLGAVEFFRSHKGFVMTTEYVLIEVANWLAGGDRRNAFRSLLTKIRTTDRFSVVPSHPNLFDAGSAMYNEMDDKRWSLTDCISFVVMERHGLTEALTADHHFSQAGFKVLL